MTHTAENEAPVPDKCPPGMHVPADTEDGVPVCVKCGWTLYGLADTRPIPPGVGDE